MTSNILANAYTNINPANPTNEISPEALRLIKNILGVNTDLPINEIIEMLNQVYIVNF